MKDLTRQSRRFQWVISGCIVVGIACGIFPVVGLILAMFVGVAVKHFHSGEVTATCLTCASISFFLAALASGQPHQTGLLEPTLLCLAFLALCFVGAWLDERFVARLFATFGW